jgi:hypothetical protein
MLPAWPGIHDPYAPAGQGFAASGGLAGTAPNMADLNKRKWNHHYYDAERACAGEEGERMGRVAGRGSDRAPLRLEPAGNQKGRRTNPAKTHGHRPRAKII